MLRSIATALVCASLCGFAPLFGAGPVPLTPVELTIVGDWQVEVHLPAADGRPAIRERITIDPPQFLTVTAEKHDALPFYDPNGPQYARGVRLSGLIAEGLTAPDLLDPASVVVRLTPDDSGPALERGKDFDFETRWGGLGRIEGGRILAESPVFISYRHVLQRLDSLVLTADGKVLHRPGEAKSTLAQPPELNTGETRLANVWFPKSAAKLTENHLFPILETAFPEDSPPNPTLAERFAPKAVAKLRSGEPLKILAWGDSVTDAIYLADPSRERWQEQFVARLRERFPNAKIELVTEAWGGRNTGSYLAVPPGKPHNFQETVLDAKPDLIISEFVNDAGLPPAQFEGRYTRLLKDFQAIGAEWIILTPHYVRPDWMGLDRERDVDEDPRPYVKSLREFTEQNNLALADASRRYGRLWRQGIPHNSLMANCINHPDPRGLAIFADALMELFPAK